MSEMNSGGLTLSSRGVGVVVSDLDDDNNGEQPSVVAEPSSSAPLESKIPEEIPEEDDLSLQDIGVWLMYNTRRLLSLRRILKITAVILIFLSLGIGYKLNVWFRTCGIAIGLDEDGRSIYPCQANATLFNTPYIVHTHNQHVSPHLFSLFDFAHLLASVIAGAYIFAVLLLAWIARWIARRTCLRCLQRATSSARAHKSLRRDLLNSKKKTH